jgi:hypothetical protein
VRHLDVVTRCLREKVVGPDFHHPMMDGRLALARLCALQGRSDECRQWFDHARGVLSAQGALPLLAISDYDEALMRHRRGTSGDAEAARLLLQSAHAAFEALGMEGWGNHAADLAVAIS